MGRTALARMWGFKNNIVTDLGEGAGLIPQAQVAKGTESGVTTCETKGALDGINRLHNTEENTSKCEKTAIRLPKMKGTKRKKRRLKHQTA